MVAGVTVSLRTLLCLRDCVVAQIADLTHKVGRQHYTGEFVLAEECLVIF